MPTVLKALPAILKFGLIGLVAIFLVLFYFLAKQHTERKRFYYIILPFSLVSIFLMVLCSVSSYQLKKADSSKEIDSLNQEILICKGSSSTNQSLQFKYNEILKSRDSLNSKISKVQHELTNKEALFNNDIMLSILEAFEDATGRTSGKSSPGISNKDLTFLRYQNAIFQKIYDFGADTGILRQALTILKRRSLDKDLNIDHLIKVTPSLIQLKRAWLKTAIFDLEKAQEELPQQAQESAETQVTLPKEVWILSNRPFKVTLTDDNYPRLKFEQDLLNKIDL